MLGYIVDYQTKDRVFFTETPGDNFSERKRTLVRSEVLAGMLRQQVRYQHQELEDLVMAHHPGAREDREEFLNWFAEDEGEANEDFYLLGIRDGIRAAKFFAVI